ncbi:MAG TPA: hypothetical protein VHD87_15120 [Acidimicrobiales bacterium]|nr:hypothetical protein [Acidimicrobiales bacterium]
MPQNHAEKAAARALAELTGEPYASCLTATRIAFLAEGAGVDLGELGDLLTPTGPRETTIETYQSRAELAPLHHLIARCALTDAAIITTQFGGLRTLVAGFAFAGLPGRRLVVELQLTGTSDDGDGCHAINTTALARSIDDALARARQLPPTHNPPMVVTGRRARHVFTPSRVNLVTAAEVGDALRDAPDVRSRHGALEWSHVAFADLGLPLPGAHDDATCPGDCAEEFGAFHGHGANDPDRAGIDVPTLLLTTWRQWVEDAIAAGAEMPGLVLDCMYRLEHGPDGVWVGLEMATGGFGVIWMVLPYTDLPHHVLRYDPALLDRVLRDDD